MFTAPATPIAKLQAKSASGLVHQQKAGQHGRGQERRAEDERPASRAVGKRAEERREQPAQQVLAQERRAHRGERDARLAHEIDAEEGHQAHPRGDRDEVRRQDDGDFFA
jgi:hypothetical protein